MKKLFFIILLFPALISSQWIEQQTPFGEGLILSVDFVDLNTGVACGWFLPNEDALGKAMFTTNSGVNWYISQVPDSSRSFVTVQFINSTTGYVAGAYNIPGMNTAVNKPEIGINFSKNRPISYIRSGRPMLSTGTRGYFLKSTNSGQSWIPYGTIPQNAYYFDCMYFNNALTGYVGVQSSVNPQEMGTIYKTTNGGINWILSYSQTNTREIRDIYFPDLNNGFAVGYVLTNDTVNNFQGLILRTSNGGNSWTQQMFYYVNNFTSIKMINSTIGFACGVNNPETVLSGIIYKTTNSGLNWNKINFQLDNCLLEGIDFIIGSGTGICYGEKFNNKSGMYDLDSTVISRTIDYGATWMSYSIHEPVNLYTGSKMINLTNWYVSGGSPFSQSSLLYTTNGGNLIGIKHVSNEVPKSFSLSQNYPNPFNPTTKINYQLPNTDFVRLIISDILGREVATLVNEKLSPGTYEVEWNSLNYASGIYFYKLSAGDFSETKKMVLLK